MFRGRSVMEFSPEREKMYRKAMHRAWTEATMCQDPSTQNGAAIVSGSFIISSRTKLPKGVDSNCWHDRQVKHARVIHAEEAAILECARMGVSTEGAIMVCPWVACRRCAWRIAEAGITGVICHGPTMKLTRDHSYPWIDEVSEGLSYLHDQNVQVVEMDWQKPVLTLFDGKPV